MSGALVPYQRGLAARLGPRSITRMLKRRLKGRPPRSSRIEPLSEAERDAIPEADFVNKKFDRATAVAASRMIVILSTPRSGSTLLCGLLNRAGLCTAHEYFQRDQYLPILAYRWGAVDEGRIDWRKYVAALERHRTGDCGVLGINLHGSHLADFSAALPHFSAGVVRHVWLQRRDKLRQAVSFGIAKQTGQWSSEFRRGPEPTYDYKFFRDRLRMIEAMERHIHAFITVNSIDCDVLAYEDLISNPGATLGRLFDIDPGDALAHGPSLQRQGNATNEAFVRRLAADILERAG